MAIWDALIGGWMPPRQGGGPLDPASYDPRMDMIMGIAGQLLENAGPTTTPTSLLRGVPQAIQQGRFQAFQRQMMQQHFEDAKAARAERAQQTAARTKFGAMMQPTFTRPTSVDDAGNEMPWTRQEPDSEGLLGAFTDAYPDVAAKGMADQFFPEAKVLGEGDTLVRGGQIVGRGAPKPVNQPAGVDEYNFAVGQGYKGSYVDFLQDTNLAREKGKLQSVAAATVGSAVDKANEARRLIGQALNHPGRTAATGVTGGLPSLYGTEKRNFDVLVRQIKGQAFLEAFQSLKGAGAITEREGAAATDAMARLDQTQSEQAFVDALWELDKIVERGLARLQERAGVAQPPGGGWTVERAD